MAAAAEEEARRKKAERQVRRNRPMLYKYTASHNNKSCLLC